MRGGRGGRVLVVVAVVDDVVAEVDEEERRRKSSERELKRDWERLGDAEVQELSMVATPPTDTAGRTTSLQDVVSYRRDR